jgi:hypothetical protein
VYLCLIEAIRSQNENNALGNSKEAQTVYAFEEKSEIAADDSLVSS